MKKNEHLPIFTALSCRLFALSFLLLGSSTSFSNEVALKKNQPTSSNISSSTNSKNNKVTIPGLNESFLSQYTVAKQEDWSKEWLDQKTCNEWKPQFISSYQEMDQKERYGTLNAFEKRQMMENEKAHSKKALDSLSSLYLQNTLKKYRKKALDWVGSMKDPLAATFLVASTMTGSEVRVKATKWMSLKSKTKIQSKTTQVSVVTPVVETLVAYQKPGSDRKISTELAAKLDQNWTAHLESNNKGTVRLQYQVSF